MVENTHCNAEMPEHVDASARTLAPESRHIVAFGLSGTTSRAADLIPEESICEAYTFGRDLRARRGLRDSARRGI